MDRYVVLMWNPLDLSGQRFVDGVRQHSAEGQEWKCVLHSKGMLALIHNSSTAGQPYLLASKQGVIFGSLFRAPIQEESLELNELPPDFSERSLFESRGAYLTQSFWGRYVCLFNDLDNGRLHASRDCSAYIPCLYSQCGSLHVFFSDFEDAVYLGVLPRLSLNLDFLLIYLHRTEPHTHESGYSEIFHLRAGECVEVHRGQAERRYLWDPRVICKEDIITDYAEARSQLRRVVQSCIHIHSRRARHLLLHLSGGFDSALVLGCLRNIDARPQITCVTRFADGPEEDERVFARLAAEQSDVELIEARWDEATVAFDSTLLEGPLLVRPSLQRLIAREHHFKSDLAQRIGATSVWTGQGGDHLFIRGLAVPYAADYAWENGLRLNLFNMVAENARYSRVSQWSIWQRLLRPSRDAESTLESDQDEARFFVAEKLTDAMRSNATHEWVHDLADIPAGKRWQVTEFSDLLNRSASMIRRSIYDDPPLISQPLLELSLRIPTYIHLSGGRHRGLARDAFSDLLPKEIRDRESKGTTDSVVGRLFSKDMGFIRSLLLEGVLAREKIISKSAIEAAAVPGKPLAIRHVFPLMSALAVEIWARSADALCQTSLRKVSGL